MKFFELPDSPNTRSVNLILIDILNTHSEWFVEDLVIEAVYGCPSKCIWNGGCVNFEQKVLSAAEIEGVFDMYNTLGISYRLTFTNRLIDDKYLKDKIGNEILQIGSNFPNAVIVANDLMENYVFQNYPKYSIIQSLCRVYQTDDDIIMNSERGLLCLPIKYNTNWVTLSKLDNYENLIVLVNEFCPVSSCEHKREHYEADNRYVLGLSPETMECVYKSKGIEAIERKIILPHHIDLQNYRRYEEIGIEHFKINGRGRSEERIILEYSKSLVLENYRELFCSEIRNRLTK